MVLITGFKLEPVELILNIIYRYLGNNSIILVPFWVNSQILLSGVILGVAKMKIFAGKFIA